MKSVPIQTILERFLAQRGYDRRRRLEAIFEVWDEVMGEPWASLARPLSIENGVLSLTVANSTVASEVSFSQQRYLARVNEHFGIPVVRDVRVRVHEGRRRALVAAKESPKSSQAKRVFNPDAVSLDAEELAWVEENVARIEGVEAKMGFRRVLMLHLKRRKWEREQGKKVPKR